jgi:phosphate starvation-inducible PhoH-like protein
MKMFLTRLGFGTRMVITGDVTQIDLPAGASGLQLVTHILEDMEDIHFSRLTSDDVVRHSLVGKIVDAYTRYDAQKQARAYERSQGGVQNPDGVNRAERRGHGPQDHRPAGPERPRRKR